MPTLIPGKPVPALAFDRLDGSRFDLSQNAGANGTLVVFYRGLHCPICIKQLASLDAHLSGFADLDVAVAALSGDGPDKTRQMAEKAALSHLTLGYGLDLAAAHQDWGLWLSSAREGSSEPELFSEPGLFYVSADGRLYFAWIQSSPFARPSTEDVLGGIRFAIEKGYPPRGQFDGTPPRAAA